MRTSLLGLVALFLAAGAPPVEAQNWRTVTASRRITGEKSVHVRVKYSAGRFNLRPSEASVLYRLESRFDDEHFDLHRDYRVSEGEGRLRIELEGSRSINLQQLIDDELVAGSLDIAVTNQTPVELSIDLGAADAELELGGLELRGIRLETGASDTRVAFAQRNTQTAERCSFRAGAAAFRLEGLGNSGCRNLSFDGGVGSLSLDFSGSWGYDAKADINVGLGAVEIRVPEEIGIKVRRSTFLMAFDAPGLRKDDGVWVSENWNDASSHLTIEINGALGTINLSRH